MKAGSSFLALSNSDRLLVLRALATLAFVRLALGIVPLRWLRAWATRPGSGAQSVGRITWAVSACTRRLPGSTCLVSAFALQRILSREGHASELHIGVARRQAGLAAHAWVVCRGETLIGETEMGDYAHLVAWRAGPDDD
jgi:hypothetical protein